MAKGVPIPLWCHCGIFLTNNYDNMALIVVRLEDID